MLAPQDTQFADGRNIIIRDGTVTTRPGIQRYLKVDGGWLAGFWFNQDNAKANDATHTGFWFPFDFVYSPWGSTVQGVAMIRLSFHTENKIIFAAGGFCYMYADGYLVGIPCNPALDASKTVDFVQANDAIYLFTDEDTAPLVWDGADVGFVAVAAPGAGDPIQNASTAIFHAGRMWMFRDQYDVFCSDLLDMTKWDYTNRSWSIEYGDGDPLVALYPFHEDSILVFKQRSVHLLSGVNAIIQQGTQLSDYVSRRTIDTLSGALSRNAIVTIGEDVWYLGFGGIWSFFRNQQNKIERQPVAVSMLIQPYIDRINWTYASRACATVHDNYVLFAVPLDGSTKNNAVLVYDRNAAGGNGAWLGVWDSVPLQPVRFMHDNEKLIALCEDMIVRQLFCDDPWDSDNPFIDTPAWSATPVYEPGDLVFYAEAGDQIWRCLQTCQNTTPGIANAAYWELVDEPWGLYDIQSEFTSRKFQVPPGSSAMTFGMGEVQFSHQNPRIDLAIQGRDLGTEQTIFAGQEYPQEEYDIADTPDWDPTNVNMDFADPHRKDYTLIVDGDAGIYCADDIWVGVWENHGLRFIPFMASDRAIIVKVTNSRGKLKLRSIMLETESTTAQKDVL